MPKSETDKLSKEIRATCPKCGPQRVAHIMATHRETGGDEVVDWCNEYRVIRCGGCKNVQLQIAHTFSEDVDYEEGPDGVPYPTYNETHTYWPPLA
jgi:transcription elongation factor Elf1